MNERSKGSSEESSSADSIDFLFEKSRFFRVIHVDGAWGGVTPQGDIHMALFSEYSAPPEVVKHAVEPGRIGKELSREGRSGVVRELEVEALIGLSRAIALRDWLSDKIQKVQQARENAQQAQQQQG